MRSDLRSLRERIRQVEAGGHRDTPLRRAYNRKLRAQRILRGGGKPNLPADSQHVWKGSLTYKQDSYNPITGRKQKVRYFELYDCCLLNRYDENGSTFKESMVVLHAPDPVAVRGDNSTITFIDGNGKRHDLVNPNNDFMEKLWENSVNGRIDDRCQTLRDDIGSTIQEFKNRLTEKYGISIN